MTTPHALHWDILMWNLDVEHVDMILRHNVQYRGSLSVLPTLVQNAQNETNWRGRHAKEAENLAFSGGKR